MSAAPVTGGLEYTPDDIENGILRGNRPSAASIGALSGQWWLSRGPFADGDARRPFVVLPMARWAARRPAMSSAWALSPRTSSEPWRCRAGREDSHGAQLRRAVVSAHPGVFRRQPRVGARGCASCSLGTEPRHVTFYVPTHACGAAGGTHGRRCNPRRRGCRGVLRERSGRQPR